MKNATKAKLIAGETAIGISTLNTGLPALSPARR
jgi:hypothetical protein